MILLLAIAILQNAKVELGWEAKFVMEDMVRGSWNWQHQNPNGYAVNEVS